MENTTEMSNLSVIASERSERSNLKNIVRDCFVGTSCLLAMTTLTFLFLLGGCGGKDAGSKSAKKIEGAISAQANKDIKKGEINVKHMVHDFKLEGFTKTGEGQWYIEGITAKMIESDILLSDIKGENFGKETSVVLTANEGVYNTGSGATELRGNVVIVTSDGGRLTTEYASWDAEKEEVKTDSFIKIEHKGLTLEGKGALVKPKEKWAMVEKDIRSSDTSSRVITCDGPLEVDYNERKAVFNKNVEITDKEGKMYANKLVAYFDPEKKAIDRIEWIGDVKAVY